METVYLFAIGILSFAIVYIVLHNRLSIMVSTKVQSFYKEQMVQDIQEFYREMESYSAILESRILRLKKLIERQEKSVSQWQHISDSLSKSRKTAQLKEFLEQKTDETKTIHAEIDYLKEEIKNLRQIRPAQTMEKAKEKAPKESEYSIAEELILDNDVSFSHKTPQKQDLPKETPENQGKRVLNILSSIGKTISPLIGGEATTGEAAAPEIPPSKEVKPAAFENMLKEKLPPLAEPKKPIETREPPRHVSAEKKIDPSELILLIEKLKISSQRPEALRSLLNQGFAIDQISELSRIPFADLEITRSIYNIENAGG